VNYDMILQHALDHEIPLPQSEDTRAGGVHIKKFKIPKGTLLISHCHTYDHPSILAVGKVELWTSANGAKEMTAPAETFIAAGVKHALVALEDSVWYCIHADNGAEPETEDS
jgi:quercetin dioxygenase-like cupin family protein